MDAERNNRIDVDIWDFIPKLKASSRLILCVALCFAVLGAIYAYGHSKMYRAELVLSPELNTNDQSGLSSISEMIGLSFDLGGASEAVNLMIYPNVVASKSFLMELVDIPVRTEDNPESVALQTYLKERDLKLMEKLLNGIAKVMQYLKPKSETVAEVQESTSSFVRLSKKELAMVDFLKSQITVDVDDKTGLIMVSSTMPDPYVAAILTDTVGKRLQSYITNYRTTKARQDYEYYDKMSKVAEQDYNTALNAYGHYMDSNMNTVLQQVKGRGEKLESDVAMASQIYTQIEQKKELARAKIQEVKPAFIVIDPVSIPIKAVGIGRVFTTLLSFIFGGMLGCAWVLIGKEFWERLKA